MDKFNSNNHICKFYFEQYNYFPDMELYQSIECNLFLQELIIKLKKRRTGEVKEVYGYKLNDKAMTQILPLLRWADYEKERDISGWDKNYAGYRDGWGYEFVCITENGKPMIRFWLNVLFRDKDKPVYEKLLDWIISNYSSRKEFKDKNLFW